MDIKQQKKLFDKNLPHIYERVCLRFEGVDGYDVYNCSVPFALNGKKYIYGRVEKRESWADSSVMLFEEVSKDCFAAINESRLYPLEDPFICFHKGELLLGGVHVIKRMGDIKSYSTYFYRGNDIIRQKYYTTGPDMMKDIRAVSLGSRLAVFTRPENQVGFTVVDGIEQLTEETLAKAPIIDLVKADGHGGVNQAIRLDSGLLGIIGHDSYSFPIDEDWYSQNHVYSVTASVFDPNARKVLSNRILATRACFVPNTPSKILPSGISMADVVFPSGALLRSDGRLDLYAGVGDAGMQRIVVDNPFREFGNIVSEDSAFHTV